MEERAWQQRLEEGRRSRLARDPTLTELDLRRLEAESEWSAYGVPRMMEEREKAKRMAEMERNYEEESGSRRRRQRVKTMDRDYDDADDDNNVENREERRYKMSEDEIRAFEVQFGVDYDPYYDDPYREDELPADQKFSVDKRYGDRVYENGEIFYKDAASGLYYRQGAKPRNLSFWS